MTGEKPYYPVLESEIAKRGIKKKDLAEMLDITYRTFAQKLNGKTEFTWSEVLSLNSVFPSVPPTELLSHS